MGTFAGLHDDLALVLGVSVTYRRGAYSAPLQAVPAESRFELDNGGPALETVRARDYLFRADELILNGATVEPAPGDTITETRAGTSQVYEVLPLAGEPCFRAEPAGEMLRVHTIYKGVAT